MHPPVPVHYLRPNHAEWTPASVIILDTETHTIPGAQRETLALSLWCADFFDRRTGKKTQPRDTDGAGTSPGTLARWVTDVTTGRKATWLFAHNLSFDLVTTRLPLHLANLGWTVSDAAVGGKSPWLRMAKGDRRLCLADSWGWLPYPLEEIAAQLAIKRPPLPLREGDLPGMRQRCAADVAILRAAMCQLMDWWDRGKLGRWTITGAGCGWNAMRHQPAPQSFVIDPDPDGVAHDRLAVYGGRRGAFAVGEHRAGPFLELDFVAAYASIAAELSVPIKRANRIDSLPVDDWRVDDDAYGIIAQVELETDVPRWPVRIDGAVFYPTGRFTTVLAGPEISEARRLGCLRAIGPGYVHRLGVALIPWGRWCLATMTGQHPDSPPMARLACKAWGRSVIGKFASRAWEKTELGPSPTFGWGYEDGWDDTHDQRGGIVDIAGRRWWVSAAGEGDNTYPAVWAWVESAVRVRLSRVLEAAGPGAVLQCDTDGLIVAARTLGTAAAHGHLSIPPSVPRVDRVHRFLNTLHPATAPLELRIKRQSGHVTVLGPQHLATATQRRLSGIAGTSRCVECEARQLEAPPGDAVIICQHIAEGITLTGRQWPGLQWQMRNGSSAGYVRPEVTATLRGPYVAAWVTANGTAVAPTVVIGAAGANVILPWGATINRPADVRLREQQHPTLDKVS